MAAQHAGDQARSKHAEVTYADAKQREAAMAISLVHAAQLNASLIGGVSTMADEADEEHDNNEELTDSVINTGTVESTPQEENIADDRDLAEAIESGKSIFK